MFCLTPTKGEDTCVKESDKSGDHLSLPFINWAHVDVSGKDANPNMDLVLAIIETELYITTVNKDLTLENWISAPCITRKR